MAEANTKPVYRITDLHESDRPRERLAALGPQALSNAELLAILLRVGVQGENAVQVGQRLLNKFGGLTGIHRVPFDELLHEHGLGEAKAAQIKAAIELGRRLTLESPEARPIGVPAGVRARRPPKHARRSTLPRTPQRWYSSKCPHWNRNIYVFCYSTRAIMYWIL